MNKKHKKAWQQIRKILEDDKRNILPQLRRSCKECLHHTACKYWIDTFKKYIREDWEYVFVHTCFEYENKIKYVEQKHGRWEETIKHGMLSASNNIGCVCSCCCKWSDNDYNYCPNCGAKMDGV